jgi:hypothetical protein
LDSSLREATCKSLMHRGNNGLICAATSVGTVNGVPWRSQRRLHYWPLKEAARTYFKMVIGGLEVSLLRRAQRWLETEIPRKSRAFLLDESCCQVPRSLLLGSDSTGYTFGSSRGSEMPGNVALLVPISTDEPLFIEAGRMLRNAWEVNRFIGSRLLCHRRTASFAIFCRHCFSSMEGAPLFTKSSALRKGQLPGDAAANFGSDKTLIRLLRSSQPICCKFAIGIGEML